jgi:hypothetical protein
VVLVREVDVPSAPFDEGRVVPAASGGKPVPSEEAAGPVWTGVVRSGVGVVLPRMEK